MITSGEGWDDDYWGQDEGASASVDWSCDEAGGEENLVMAIQGLRVDGKRGRSRPKLTREQVIWADMNSCGIKGPGR